MIKWRRRKNVIPRHLRIDKLEIEPTEVEPTTANEDTESKDPEITKQNTENTNNNESTEGVPEGELSVEKDEPEITPGLDEDVVADENDVEEFVVVSPGDAPIGLAEEYLLPLVFRSTSTLMTDS